MKRDDPLPGGAISDSMHEEIATEAPIRILIADDDKTIGDILHDLISKENRSVEICQNGAEAMERIRRNAYDLIILDLVMPKADGMEVLKFAKEMNNDAVVIILTGHASLETAITAVKEGAYDYIRKPCKLEEIELSVDNALEKIRLNRENRDLLNKLEIAYEKLHALMIHKENKTGETDRSENINFFSPNLPNLHYLYAEKPTSDKTIDQLQALTSLRESGSLTESEFRAFKRHLLTAISASE
jgi:DNA-binding response OmpR family regulator